MPLWAALPRHQRLVYIICAFVHTTRKDVRSKYHIHVAYIRTCIYVYFVHLFFNSFIDPCHSIRWRSNFFFHPATVGLNSSTTELRWIEIRCSRVGCVCRYGLRNQVLCGAGEFRHRDLFVTRICCYGLCGFLFFDSECPMLRKKGV